MLNHAPVTTMLPVKDLERARDFYLNKLGLEAIGPRPDGKFLLRCNGTTLALFPKPEGTKAEHTAVSFSVDDIVAAIRDLKGRGVGPSMAGSIAGISAFADKRLTSPLHCRMHSSANSRPVCW